MGGGARRHYGLTRAQLCQMATLARLAARRGSFVVVDAAEALQVELPCAARYLRDLEALAMVARIGRSGDRHARIRYVVTERWRDLAQEAPSDALLRGSCAGCGRSTRDLVIFRRALWCPTCLTEPFRTDVEASARVDCPQCDCRLELDGERRGSRVVLRVRCPRCRGEARVEGDTADAAWAALLQGLADVRARRPGAVPERQSALPVELRA